MISTEAPGRRGMLCRTPVCVLSKSFVYLSMHAWWIHVYLLLKRSTQERTADRLMATTLHVRDIHIVRVDGVERLFPFDAPLPTPLIRPTLQKLGLLRHASGSILLYRLYTKFDDIDQNSRACCAVPRRLGLVPSPLLSLHSAESIQVEPQTSSFLFNVPPLCRRRGS